MDAFRGMVFPFHHKKRAKLLQNFDIHKFSGLFFIKKWHFLPKKRSHPWHDLYEVVFSAT